MGTSLEECSIRRSEGAHSEFYVYLYRDPRTLDVRYVGKGVHHRVDDIIRKMFLRGKIDLPGPDKALVKKWWGGLIREGRAPVIEVMPCADERQALAVEAALISAYWSSGRLLNKVHGHHARFVPAGLPAALAPRAHQTPLTRADLAGGGGAIVVYISPRSFLEGDARAGAAPVVACCEAERQAQLRNQVVRIRRWWQLGNYIREWADGVAAPSRIVAVTGPPARRWVWGSLHVRPGSWDACLETRISDGLYELPTRVDPDKQIAASALDAGKLRGRVLEPNAVGPVLGSDGSRKFGGIKSQFFDVIAPV